MCQHFPHAIHVGFLFSSTMLFGHCQESAAIAGQHRIFQSCSIDRSWASLWPDFLSDHIRHSRHSTRPYSNVMPEVVLCQVYVQTYFILSYTYDHILYLWTYTDSLYIYIYNIYIYVFSGVVNPHYPLFAPKFSTLPSQWGDFPSCRAQEAMHPSGGWMWYKQCHNGE